MTYTLARSSLGFLETRASLLEIPRDKTGDFDMISRILEKNWKIAKWVALGAIIFEIICVKSIASVTYSHHVLPSLEVKTHLTQLLHISGKSLGTLFSLQYVIQRLKQKFA
ncbi:hypothetical protein POM88_003622 [Heracleum sosnowskyi]|uniref:Uncharacterized protein n=1 Tax=Heracleum sosnowskyi TaxID=360622 RepID=A0AAD8JGN6_9APIA|nr:hypothetical protein POM88_003622 [Heracleum sosnowskyi]